MLSASECKYVWASVHIDSRLFAPEMLSLIGSVCTHVFVKHMQFRELLPDFHTQSARDWQPKLCWWMCVGVCVRLEMCKRMRRMEKA